MRYLIGLLVTLSLLAGCQVTIGGPRGIGTYDLRVKRWWREPESNWRHMDVQVSRPQRCSVLK